MSKRIFITGISGQDGVYLTEYMLELGHEVHGIIRRNSVTENQSPRLEHLRGKVYLYYGDMIDYVSLENALRRSQPDYVFHLAAQSHVRVSFDIPEYTMAVNSDGTLKLLEACRRICPYARIYNAASSEMFGLSVDEDGYQRESTPMNPTSPYGVSKVAAYNMVRHYRRAYNLFACNGILFNHESPVRGSAFVTQKVVKTAVEIHLGLKNILELGNLDASRDWGHAFDYVRAMWQIVNHVEPMDFVISTGRSHTVREMCQVVFSCLGLDYEKYVIQNPRYLRPEELTYLCGDSTKARTILGWEPIYTFRRLMEEMIENLLIEIRNASSETNNIIGIKEQ